MTKFDLIAIIRTFSIAIILIKVIIKMLMKLSVYCRNNKIKPTYGEEKPYNEEVRHAL